MAATEYKLAEMEANSTPNGSNLQEEVVDEKEGNADDRKDMFRMGKVQEMRRNFRFFSIFGFSVVLIQSWEVALSCSVFGLVNGGTAGYIWMSFLCSVGFVAINASIAEMGSMAPTTGGQYHWVSEFAPRQYQKFISYLVGWLCVIGWQTASAATAFLTGTQIQGLVVLNYPDTYVAHPWHGTMLTIAVAAFSVVFNIIFARKLPVIEYLVLCLHIFGFVAVVTVLWVYSLGADAASVFTEFDDGGGWNNQGLSTLVGVIAGIIPLMGADAAVHMSEELQDAGRALPYAIFSSTLINNVMGWVMVITLCFCIGDLSEVLESPTGYPHIQVFYNTTRSRGGATAMEAIVVTMSLFGHLAVVATASRQLFAFARDRAVPFSSWFAKVPRKWNIPINSILATFICSTLLSLINIGSDVALNNITSLGTSGLLSSYICSIGCMIWRRCTNRPLLPSKFSLGRWGLSINITSVLLLVVWVVFAFFPPTPNPNLGDMNWDILIYGAVVLFSMVYYFIRGRHRYAGPVEYVRKLE